RLRVLLNPVKRHIRNATVLITAADIRMRPDEPSLFDHLVQLLLGIPESGSIWLSMLVNGHCVECIFDYAAQFRVMELKLLFVEFTKRLDGNPKRADGVPDAQKLDLDDWRIMLRTKIFGAYGIGAVVTRPVQLIGLHKFIIIVGIRVFERA